MSVPLPLTLVTDTGIFMSSWEEIDCDSDLFVPADAIHLRGPVMQDGIPVPWQQAKMANRLVVSLGPAPMFTGNKTRAARRKSGRESGLTIEGVDSAKILVDCPPAIRFAKPAGNLAAFATELCLSLGVAVAPGGTATIPRISATSATATEPVWSILQRLAQEVGCWLWCDAAGIVHCEPLAPYYAIPPVDTLVSAPTGPGAAGNNILDYELLDDVGERYSEIKIKGTATMRGYGPVPAGGTYPSWVVPVESKWVDPELAQRGIYRPLTLFDPLVKNIQQAASRSIREAMLAKIQGTKIVVWVEGFTTLTGIPWQTTQMVMVSIPEDGVVGPYMIAGRRLLQDARQGSRTMLTLIEPGVL